MITDLTTGLIYRNPRPHVRAVHAYFPCQAVLPHGEMIASLVIGEAFEAVNLRTHLARSTDGGVTWTLEGPLLPRPADSLFSDAGRVAVMPDGQVAAFISRHDRRAHPDAGLANEANLGFTDSEALLLRSRDGGRSWQAPEPIETPLVGPVFEMCAPIIALRDGRWVLATSTWHNWDGYGPNGLRAVGLVSHDGGQSWPDYFDIMHHSDSRIFYWESKIIELPDGRLLDTAWAYDRETQADLPNQFACSADGGATWSPPRSTGLLGQTLTPLALPDGRILTVYRRMDAPGLWAAFNRLEGDAWVTDEQTALWGAGASGLTGSDANMIKNFNVLKFGAPHLKLLADGSIHLVIWCVEDGVGCARWFRFRVG